MTRSSRTAGILSLVTPPIHPQAKRLDGEGPRIWAPPLPCTAEEGSVEGPWHVSPPSVSVLASSPLLPFSLLSLCLSLTTLLLSSYAGLHRSHPPLCLSESQTLFLCLSAPLLFLSFLSPLPLLRAIALFQPLPRTEIGVRIPREPV